jgi:hypothetical protein
MAPPLEHVGHEVTRRGWRLALAGELRARFLCCRRVAPLAWGRSNDRGVQVAYPTYRVGVLVSLHRLAAIAADQRERQVAGEVIPRCLEVDRRQHVARLPEKRHHLAVGANRSLTLHAAWMTEPTMRRNPAWSTWPASVNPAIVTAASSMTSVSSSEDAAGSKPAASNSASNCRRACGALGTQCVSAFLFTAMDTVRLTGRTVGDVITLCASAHAAALDAPANFVRVITEVARLS